MGAARTTYIDTPRLSLRPMRAGDIPALLPALGNYDVIRWLGRVPYPYAATDAQSFIDKNADKDGLIWFIHHLGELVGGVSIDGELGYWIRRTAWGNGFATEAAQAAVAAHFRQSAEDLPSGHYLENERSSRVLRKLGFRPTSVRLVASRALAQQIESQGMVLSLADWKAAAPDLSGYRFSATPLRERRGQI